jgi:hypothetical protein
MNYKKDQFKILSKIKKMKIKKIRTEFSTNLMLKDEIEEKINLKNCQSEKNNN